MSKYRILTKRSAVTFYGADEVAWSRNLGKKGSTALIIAGTVSPLLPGGHHPLGIAKEMKFHGNAQCYIYN